MRLKDERVKMTNEVLNGIKVIKLYAWEVPMERIITGLRDKELSLIRKAAFLKTFSDILNSTAPFLVGNIQTRGVCSVSSVLAVRVQVALSTFATFIWMDEANILTPSIAFVSLTLFNQLRTPMSTVAELITQSVQVGV